MKENKKEGQKPLENASQSGFRARLHRLLEDPKGALRDRFSASKENTKGTLRGQKPPEIALQSELQARLNRLSSGAGKK